MGERIWRAFRRSAGYLSVAAVCGVFVASALLQISKTGKTLQEIVFGSALSFVFGLSVTLCLKIQGLIDGDSDPRMISTVELYGQTLDAITSMIGRLDEWCDRKNAEILLRIRRRLLSAAGLSVEECFDGQGVALPFPKKRPERGDRETVRSWRRQYRTYREAATFRMTRLSAVMLTGEGTREDDPNREGRSHGKYLASSERREAVSKLLYALVFGYFGVVLLTDATLAGVLWNLLEAAVFVTMGLIKRYQAKRYVLDEYRQGMIRKINYLQMFMNEMKEEIRDGKCSKNNGAGALRGGEEGAGGEQKAGNRGAERDAGEVEKISAGDGASQW